MDLRTAPVPAALSAFGDLKGHLDLALARGDVAVHVQAEHALDGGGVVAVEAPLRWRLLGRVDIPPTAFLPLAEETGAIMSLGDRALVEGCAATAALSTVAAVNVGARQLADPNLADRCVRVAAGAGLRPQDLRLEVARVLMLRDVDGVKWQLDALRARGLRVVLDDADGTCLDLLDRLPLDGVKIDAEVISRLGRDRSAGTVLRALVAAAHEGALPVIAEGVETEAHLEAVVAAGVDAAMGYRFAVPMPLADLAAHLRGLTGG